MKAENAEFRAMLEQASNPPQRNPMTIFVTTAGVQATARQGYRVTLAFHFDPVPELVTLLHNPEGWTHERTAKWQPRGAPGVERDALDWTGNEPARLSFDFLTTSEDTGRLEDQVLRPLERLPFEVRRPLLEPPQVTVQFGAHGYRGSISSVSVNRVRTDAAGLARVAQVSVQMMANAKIVRGPQ